MKIYKIWSIIFILLIELLEQSILPISFLYLFPLLLNDQEINKEIKIIVFTRLNLLYLYRDWLCRVECKHEASRFLRV